MKFKLLHLVIFFHFGIIFIGLILFMFTQYSLLKDFQFSILNSYFNQIHNSTKLIIQREKHALDDILNYGFSDKNLNFLDDKHIDFAFKESNGNIVKIYGNLGFLKENTLLEILKSNNIDNIIGLKDIGKNIYALVSKKEFVNDLQNKEVIWGVRVLNNNMSFLKELQDELNIQEIIFLDNKSDKFLNSSKIINNNQFLSLQRNKAIYSHDEKYIFIRKELDKNIDIYYVLDSRYYSKHLEYFTSKSNIIIVLFILLGLIIFYILKQFFIKQFFDINEYIKNKIQNKKTNIVNTHIKEMDDIIKDFNHLFENHKSEKIKYKILMESSLDAIFLLDPQTGFFIEANKTATSLYGYSKKEFELLKAHNLDIIYSKEEIVEEQKNIIKKGNGNFISKHKLKNGKVIDVYVNSIVIKLQHKIYLYVTIRDISKDIANEKELKEVIKQQEMAKEFAQKANSAKSMFLANMSHEIRTPLNGVIGLIKLVLKTDLTNEQKDYLLKTKQSSDALLSIINDILDYSKIEAGKLHIVKSIFSLDDVLKNISDLFSYQVEEKSLDFIFDIDPNIPKRLNGDSLRIGQILNNLVGNSVKFTHKGSIILRVKEVFRKNEILTLEFSVQDTGIGISEQKQSRLFKAFEQGDDSTTKTFGGSGLGLVISKELVEMMGGSIDCISQENKGTTFIFRVKVGIAYQDDLKNIDLKSFGEKTFLVVEDNEVERKYLVKILKNYSSNVDEAVDGKDAYEKLKSKKYDHLITDWNLPKTNGISLLQKLKNEGIYVSNILMVTGFTKDALLKEAKKKSVGIDNVLMKPYPPSDLIKALSLGETKEKIVKKEQEYSISVNNKKCLLVEDNDINKIVAKKILENIGFVVDLASNGKEAVEMIDKNFYSIVFMDLHMPIMDGFEATKRVRKFNKNIPIIALSAAVMQDDKELTFKAGMNEHIAKPIDEDKLAKIIEKYCDINKKEVLKKEFLDSEIDIEDIDFNKLLNMLNTTDMKTIYDMYDSFKNRYNNFNIKVQTLERYSKEFKEYFHTLKGVSSNLYIKEIPKLCIDIENGIEIDSNIQKLEKKINSICKDIEEKISPKIQIDIIEKTNLMEKIDKLINSIDNFLFISRSSIKELIVSCQDYNIDFDLNLIENSFEEKKFDNLKNLLDMLKLKISEVDNG